MNLLIILNNKQIVKKRNFCVLPPSIQGMYAHEINFKELFEWLTNYLQKCTAVANCKEYLTLQDLNFKLHEHERIIF